MAMAKGRTFGRRQGVEYLKRSASSCCTWFARRGLHQALCVGRPASADFEKFDSLVMSHPDCAALGPADPARIRYIVRSEQVMAFVEQRPSPSARAGLDGAAGARELTSDDGRSSTRDTPSAWQAGATPTCAASGFRHQERVPCSRFNPSSPAFSLHVQDRVRGVQLVLQGCASSARTFASSRLRSAGFAPRFFAANPAASPCAAPCAIRCELYNPSVAGLCAAIRSAADTLR